MLIFIDRLKWISVFRLEQSEEGTTRFRIGNVNKSKMEMNDELRSALDPAEFEEVEKVIAMYGKAAETEKSLHIQKFPQIIREVTEYIIASDTPEFERRVLIGCLMDGVRQVRKFERGEL